MRRQTHDPFRAGQQLRVPQLDEYQYDGTEAPLVDVLAYVDRYPPKENAGAEWMLHHLLRHLVRQGHRVRVATACDERYQLDGVDVWPHGYVETLAEDADVVVGHLLWTKEAVTLCADLGKPLVYLLHNDMQVAHWSLHPANVTLMVANSRWVAESVGWPGPTTIVRPPTLLDDYAIDDDAFDRPWITLVNPNPDKGGAVFYEVARKMPQHRFATVAGAYGTQLRAKSDNVVAWRSTPTMREDVYSRTRVLLVPSRYESWGRVACEAMAAGCPVIAHPTPGLVEALGDAAMFRDRDDPRQWIDALRQLDDRATFDEWSRRSRDRAKFLHDQSSTDLEVWEAAIRTCAVASRP